jgi:putative membrane protein
MMKLAHTAVAVVALTLSSGLYAADTKSGATKLSSNDRHFVMEAAQGGMAEVELGKLAQQKGSRDDVKQFGQRMVEDHGKANQELESIASKLGAPMPKDAGKKHTSDVNKLGKLSGDKFDREYAENMVKDHEKDVSAFEKQAKKGDSEELKQFAAKTLPTLQEHLKMARAMKDGAKSK